MSESRKFSNPTQDVYFTAAEKRRLGITDDQDRTGWSGSIAYAR